MPTPVPRAPTVASLLPSATELVCAVGAEAQLVGISHECDWPASVAGRTVLTRPKVKLVGRSAEIDRDVRAVLRDALSVYDLDVEALATVAPEVIVTQDLCEVCAVSLRQVQSAVAALVRPGTTLVNLSPLRLQDVRGDFGRVGAALGRSAEAATALAEFDARLRELSRRTTAAVAAAPAGRPRRVLTIEWIDPVMVGGIWMLELVELAGGTALVTRAGDHAPMLDRAALAALDPAPEVVLVKPCGFELDRTVREADTVSDLLAAMPWPAVAAGEIWLADGSAYFNRPGPRLADSAEILAAILHPQACADLAQRHAGAFRRFGLRAA